LFALHLLGLRRDWLTRWFVLSFVGLVIVIPAMLMFLKVSGLEDFFWDRLRLQQYDVKRFASQGMAISSLAQSPFGVGPGQAKHLLGLNTHNVYLMVAVENGLATAICFVLFLGTTLWIALRGALGRGPFKEVYACCVAILAGVLVNSLTIDSLHWRHFFLFLAVPVGLWKHQLASARAAQVRVDLTRRSPPPGPAQVGERPREAR
jgi:hypothetical protein